MIIDVTGIELTPGERGEKCMGNGKTVDQSGRLYECCCDECDYLMCCAEGHCNDACVLCRDPYCPRRSS
jgi:hypothetical protein